MSELHDIECAIALIEKSPNFSDFCGPATADDILTAENLLGFKFPLDYRAFLERLGAGSFGSQEFFGIIPNNVPGTSIPSVVWLTLKDRQTVSAPLNILPIWNDGTGHQACIHIEPRAPQNCGIYLMDPEYREVSAKADSFGAFFLEIVNREAAFLGLEK